jgi:hypothetical protein
MIEKILLYRLPSRHHQLLLVLLVSGFGPAPGSTGFGSCVSACPPPSPGIVAEPSTASTSAPLPRILHRNSVAALAAGETTAHILSADTGAASADGPAGAARALAFRLAW